MPRRKQLPSTAEGEDLERDGSETEETQPRKRVRWEGSAEEQGENDESPEEEDTSSSSEKEKVCLVASYQFGRVACAYYDPVKCTICIFDDSPDNRHFDLTKAFLEQASPDVVLTSAAVDDHFMDVLRDHMDSSRGTFHVRPRKEFVPVKGRDRLLSLRLLSELPMTNAQDTASDLGSTSEARNAYDFMRRRREVGEDPAMQKWNASVRLANYASVENSPLCLGCIGALLDYLTRARAVANLEDDGIGELEVRNIEPMPLLDSMQINADALFSLQIFEDENHASIHSDKTKEGLSLFGILNNTKTTLGRALMREWFFRPSMSLEVINARHDAVQCFLEPDNSQAKSAMLNHLNGMKNVAKIIAAMRGGRARVSDWQGIVKFAYHGLLLRDALLELSRASGVPIVRRLLEALDVAKLRDIGNMVNQTIDWEESTNAGRLCVRPRVDEELDNLKHIYNGIDAVLSKVAEQVSATIPPDYTSSLNVVYFPQLGFLLCVPMQEEWNTSAGIRVLDGWSFQFSSDSHVYFKSQEMHDMDVHIGDLHPAIVDREIEIVHALQEKVLAYEKTISDAYDVCAELDCLLSFALASLSNDYRRPHMTEDNVTDIKQGRHPLQELVVDTFVPNDTYIAGGAGIGVALDNDTDEDFDSQDDNVRMKNSIIVCTGANACGKSVYLKQVALIHYMAQIGCFVPAEQAILGIVDKIFTRVQTRESVSRVQSAFMIDLNQVSLALRNATERSLILLDEFGKGTLPSDGAGLFCGVLKELLNRGPTCPKVVATTHFHEVIQNDFLSHRRLPITFVHMQVLLASSSGETSLESDEEGSMQIMPGDRITYLYKVTHGYSLHSHAITCAELFGIPKRVAVRAQYVSELLARHEIYELLDEDMTEAERKDLEDAEEVCRRFIAWNIEGSTAEGQPVRDSLARVLGRTP